MGFKVGVLDADIYGPSIPIMFDVANERPLAVDVGGKSKMRPIENYGVKVLSIGFFTKPDQAVVWRGPMAAKALNQMIFDAHWDTLDFLLLDLPPGTGDIHLSLMQSLPITGAVVVSTPQNVALADAKKGVAMFQQESINVPVLGIIENMAYFTPAELPNNKYYIFGQDGAKNLSEDLEVPFLGALPLVQSIREAGDVGRPAALQEGTPLEEALPFLQSDGGDIKLLSIEDDKIVNVQLLGACVGCSVNQMTLKSGVEMTIKKYAPQIEKVVNVEA